MTIFRYKKDGRLYKIYHVVRSMCMCEEKGYQAIPLYGKGSGNCYNGFKVESLDDFEVVAYT
jgi:hypothetical protein